MSLNRKDALTNDPNCNDVLCGRGGRIAKHPGNIYFRELVNAHRALYVSKDTKKSDKARIAAKIVETIRNLDPPGRFLMETKTLSAENGFCSSSVWIDIGDDRARKKTAQAMREQKTLKKQQKQLGQLRTQEEMNNVDVSLTTNAKILCVGNNCLAECKIERLLPQDDKKKHAYVSQPAFLSGSRKLSDDTINEYIFGALHQDQHTNNHSLKEKQQTTLTTSTPMCRSSYFFNYKNETQRNNQLLTTGTLKKRETYRETNGPTYSGRSSNEMQQRILSMEAVESILNCMGEVYKPIDDYMNRIGDGEQSKLCEHFKKQKLLNSSCTKEFHGGK